MFSTAIWDNDTEIKSYGWVRFIVECLHSGFSFYKII